MRNDQAHRLAKVGNFKACLFLHEHAHTTPWWTGFWDAPYKRPIRYLQPYLIKCDKKNVQKIAILHYSNIENWVHDENIE
jgi:hypothetical protein